MIPRKKSLMVLAMLPFLIFFVIAVILSIPTLTYVQRQAISQSTMIPQGIEERAIIPLLYNKCFSYKSEIGQMKANIVDIDKFTQATLNGCFPDINSRFAFLITLEVPNANFPSMTLNTLNWPQTPGKTEIIHDVFAMQKGIKYPARMKIGVKYV